MEHARKMVLVDPRILDTLRSPPPPTDTLGRKVQALDDEMMDILDRKDLDDRTKVTLYNQVLQRYNVLSDKHVKEPTRVITVNESGTKAREAAAAAAAGTGVEGAVGAPATTSEIEADVVDTVPKTMQGKARRLMERMKRNMSWTARGELIHEGVPIAGNNVVDLVNDVLRKRNTNPTGWQPFARQLRAMNLPMELIGNVAKRDYIRQATTPTSSTPGRRRRIPATLALVVVVVVLAHVAHEDRSVGHPSRIAAVRWNIPCSPHLQNVNARLWRHWLVGKTFKTVQYVSIAHCLPCQPMNRTRTVPSLLRYLSVDFT